MNVFYAPAAEEGFAVLSGEESHHCVKVLRMRTGQELFLTNGKGDWFLGSLTQADPRACMVEIREKKTGYGQRPAKLHMAVAPTKQSDRFEWFLEKGTECGIDDITPVICEKSERNAVKSARLEKVLLSAMKQSMRAFLPRLHPAVKLKDFLQQPFDGLKFIAHCGDGPKSGFSEVCQPGQNALILIGPEGDFSPEEVLLAREKGFVSVSLGQHRLRTETAALALCIAFNFMNDLL
jgi:16S rRNA (uracil1498-N3)-methyltransferase